MFLRGHHMTMLRTSRTTLLLTLIVIAHTTLLGGCRLMHKGNSSEAMAVELQKAPPVRLDALDGRRMLVMQAPNPGWSYRLDKDERELDGWVVFITIRKPDPAFMYPQRIVDKRLLTEVETKHSIRVMARLLEHNEKGTRDQYAPLELDSNAQP